MELLLVYVCWFVQVFFTNEYLEQNPQSKPLVPKLKTLMEELVRSTCIVTYLHTPDH